MISQDDFNVSVGLSDPNTQFSAHHLTMEGYSYFAMPNNSNYFIYIQNNSDKSCDAEIFIDAQSVGTWRVEAYGNINIERPAHCARKFLFVKENSMLASIGNIISGSQNNGLVRIVLKKDAEKPRRKNPARGFTNTCMNSANYDAGATVLGESSSQTFGTVKPLTYTTTSEICFRLIVSNEVKKLEVVPLSTRDSTPPRFDETHKKKWNTNTEFDNLSSSTTTLPFGSY